MATPQNRLGIDDLFDPPPRVPRSPARTMSSIDDLFDTPAKTYGAFDSSTEGAWSIADADKVKGWYRGAYGRELPVSAFGQSGTHDSMGLDHSDSIDVALNPRSDEGKAFIAYLRQQKIPFLAYDRPVAGAATAAHIHVGFPSHKGSGGLASIGAITDLFDSTEPTDRRGPASYTADAIPRADSAKFTPNVNYTQQPFDLTRLAPMSPSEAATEYMRHFGAQAGLKDKYLDAFVAQAIKEGGADFTYTQGEKKGQPISREDFESIKKTGFNGVDVRDSVKSLAESYLKAQKSPTIEPYTPTFSENYVRPAERFLGVNTQEGIKTTAAEELARSAIDTATFGAVRLPHVSDARIHNERERQLVDLGGQVGNVLGVAVPFAATSHLVASALRIPALASLVSALEESGAAGRALVRGVRGAATFGGVQAGREITNVPYGESKGLVEAAKSVGREAIIGGVSQGLTPPEAGALRAGATFAGTAAGTDVLEGKDLGQTGVDALKNLVVALALHRDTPEDVKAEAEGLLKDAVKAQPKADEQAEAISPPVTSNASTPETSTEATTAQVRAIPKAVGGEDLAQKVIGERLQGEAQATKADTRQVLETERAGTVEKVSPQEEEGAGEKEGADNTARIIQYLKDPDINGSAQLEDIAEDLGLTNSEVTSALLSGEMSGELRQLAGRRFQLTQSGKGEGRAEQKGQVAQQSGAGKSEIEAEGGSAVSPKPAPVQNEEAAQKTNAQVKAAKLPKEIEEVITGLPDSVKAQIDVRGFKVVDFPPENQGEGGRYDPRSKVVYIEKDEPDPDVFLHETLHNYTEKLIDPKFVQDYIRARYPKTVADEELAKDPKDFFYNYFSIENITNDLTSYFRGQKLSPELKRVFDDYYQTPESQHHSQLQPRTAEGTFAEGPLIDRQRYQETMARNGSEYGIESEADIPAPEEAYQTFKDEYAAVKESINEYETQLQSGKRLRENVRRGLEAKADSARERLAYLEEHAGNLFGERAAREITGNVARETKQSPTEINTPRPEGRQVEVGQREEAIKSRIDEIQRRLDAINNTQEFSGGGRTAGRGGKRRLQQIDASIRRAQESVRLSQERDALQRQLDDYKAGKRTPVLPSNETVERTIDDFYSATLKAGDRVSVGNNSVTVKRVSRKSITDTNGVNWAFREIGLVNEHGKAMDAAELRAAFKSWRAGEQNEISSRQTPEPPQPRTVSKASGQGEEGARQEKVNAKTGLTRTQTNYLAGELEKVADKAIEENTGTDEAGNKLKADEFKRQFIRDSESRIPADFFRKPMKEPVTIKVPDDGEFTVRSAQAANRLHQKITGKPIEGFERAKDTGLHRTSNAVRLTKAEREAVNTDLDTVIQEYGSEQKAYDGLLKVQKQLAADPEAAEQIGGDTARLGDLVEQLESRLYSRGQLNKAKAERDSFTEQLRAAEAKSKGRRTAEVKRLRGEVVAANARVGQLEFHIGKEYVRAAPKEGKASSVPVRLGPGAANIGDVPPESQIKQLTEAVKAATTPKQSLSDRFNVAQTIADKASATSDALTQGLTRVKATSSALYDGLTKLPTFTNFKKTLGEWLGVNQKADYELMEFVKTANKQVPDSVRQEAITNYIQAGGDESVLRQRADASTGKLKKGYEVALTLTPEEKLLATNISSYLDARLQEGIDAGLLDHSVENYITQIWKKENPVTRKLRADIQTGKLPTNFRYARQRLFESYFEGEQSGFIPASKKFSDLIAAYDQSFNRALSARAFVKSLTQGSAADGRPLVTVSGSGSPVPDASAPEAVLIRPHSKVPIKPSKAELQAHPDAESVNVSDYKPIDHPALRKWKWVQAVDGTPVMLQGELLVHPEIYEHLSNVLKASALRQNRVGKFALNAQSTIKQTMLSVSGFHQVQEAVHAIGHRINPANARRLDFDDPAQMELVNHGLQVADFNAQSLFSEGLASGNLTNAIPVIGTRILKPYTQYLFHDYIPRLKMETGLHIVDRNMKRYKADLESGMVTRDQIVELSARQANAAYGELNYKYMGRNPTTQDVLRLFLLAPDFLEARGRFVGQAIKPHGREQLVALGVLAATQFIGARILNKVFDDDWHWDRPFSFVLKGHEYTLRSVPEDLYRMAHEMFPAQGGVAYPRQFIYNRLSPAMRTAAEAITGRDERGVKRDLSEQVEDLLKMPIPIALRRKGDDAWWESFMNGFGVQEKKYRTKAEEMMGQILGDKMGQPPTGDELKRSQAKRDFTRALREGKTFKDIKPDLDKALADGTLSRTDVPSILRKRQTKKIEDDFKQLGLEDALNVYEVMTPEERRQTYDELLRKRPLLLKLPEAKRKELEKRMSVFVRPLALPSPPTVGVSP